MSRLVKLFIGLSMLITGLLGLAVFVDPELPMRIGFEWRSASEPFTTLIQRWFEFSNHLQTVNVLEYYGILLICFTMAVAGFFTCLKSR